MSLNIKSKRLSYKGFSYPLNIVIFEDPSKLGFFNYAQFQIGINKKFIFEQNEQVIKDILRHELAHLYTFLKYGVEVQAHGPEFQQVCQSFGWGKHISKATFIKSSEGLENSSRMVQKVEKLLRLSSSNNEHESRLATAKANELMLKHNLQILKEAGSLIEDETYLKVVFESKRASSKLYALYEILQLFYVRPVINRGLGKTTTLEVIGSKSNVEVADYVSKVLSLEFDRLWIQAKKEFQLSGINAKNNYFKGLQKGYIETIQTSRKAPTQSLSLIKKDLSERLQLVYPSLRRTSIHSGRQDFNAQCLGFEHAKKISLNKGVQQKQGLRLISK